MQLDHHWFTVQELSNSLFGIGELGHREEVNSFLVVGAEESLLIDTGMGLFSMRSVVEQITDRPCKVLNTHSHFDHVGSNHEFSEIALFDHHANREISVNGYSAEYLLPWIKGNQFVGASPEGMPAPYIISPFPQASFFSDGEIVSELPINLEALHTPGHSDDSVCFWNQSNGWLFAGDLLYDGPIYIEKDGGLEKFRDSVTKISMLEDLQAIYSCHNSFQLSLEKFEALQAALLGIPNGELREEVVIEGQLRLVPELQE